MILQYSKSADNSRLDANGRSSDALCAVKITHSLTLTDLFDRETILGFEIWVLVAGEHINGGES